MQCKTMNSLFSFLLDKTDSELSKGDLVFKKTKRTNRWDLRITTYSLLGSPHSNENKINKQKPRNHRLIASITINHVQQNQLELFGLILCPCHIPTKNYSPPPTSKKNHFSKLKTCARLILLEIQYYNKSWVVSTHGCA